MIGWLMTNPVSAIIGAVLIAGMVFVYKITKLCLALPATTEEPAQLEPAATEAGDEFKERIGFTETRDGKYRRDGVLWFCVESAERADSDTQDRLEKQHEIWSRKRRWAYEEARSQEFTDAGW